MGMKNGKPVLLPEHLEFLVNTSGLSEPQVKTKYEHFLKEYPDNRITHSGFQDMIEQAIPGKSSEELCNHVFRIYDDNNDGSIDFTEFMLVYYCLTEGEPEEILKRIFRVFDVNSDGKITLDEVKNIVTSMFDLLKHNNPIEATDEFIAQTAFLEMDGNNDGAVDSDEFIKAALEQKEFTKLLTVNIMSIFN